MTLYLVKNIKTQAVYAMNTLSREREEVQVVSRLYTCLQRKKMLLEFFDSETRFETPLRLGLLRVMYKKDSITSIDIYRGIPHPEIRRLLGEEGKTIEWFFDQADIEVAFKEPLERAAPVVPEKTAPKSSRRRKTYISIGERVHLRHSSIASRVARRRRNQ